MVRHAVAAAIVIAGCYHPANEAACSVTCEPGSSCPNGLSCIDGLCRGSSDTCGGAIGDANPDTAVPKDGCVTYGTGLFQWQTCALDHSQYAMPTAFDTDTDCSGPYGYPVLSAGSLVCVVYAHSLSVTGLHATGTAPLVLIADDLSITGTLDVSGAFGVTAANGAGSGFGCFSGSASPVGAGGSGGAAGGGGGAGGASDNGTGPPATLPRTLAQLQGGCPGGAGYGASSVHGFGGPGGGVIYLIGATSIAINATSIVAAGAHGEGGVSGQDGGGGGGGAGGLIGLDSPGLKIGTAVSLCANGGGGGGGGSGPGDGAVQFGSPGADGCFGVPPASGGGPGGSGGHGGSGSDTAQGSSGMAGSPEGNFSDSAGGGGGGGGAGYVYVRGNLTASQLDIMASVSPAAQ